MTTNKLNNIELYNTQITEDIGNGASQCYFDSSSHNFDKFRLEIHLLVTT